ncbi:hypothetical protein [Bradyrhizobium sp.]|uniref:hypothetical protein n=1 Tax=Bradyrhizobium sp. TaxID=376 RepID=UPI00391C7BC2
MLNSSPEGQPASFNSFEKLLTPLSQMTTFAARCVLADALEDVLIDIAFLLIQGRRPTSTLIERRSGRLSLSDL